jgi:hypothetical protein
VMGPRLDWLLTLGSKLNSKKVKVVVVGVAQLITLGASAKRTWEMNSDTSCSNLPPHTQKMDVPLGTILPS